MEIRCTACRHLTLARAEPVYEDFKKVAETFVCTACGYRYPSREKTPFVDANGRPRVFSDADKPAAVKVFQADERRRSCTWCRFFIVNPFSQRCGLNNREVEATDVCARFAAKPDEPADSGQRSTSAAGSRFDALFQQGAPAPAAAVAPAPAPAPSAPPAKPAEKKTAGKASAKAADKKPVGRPRKKA
jgi:hypothetical protein